MQINLPAAIKHPRPLSSLRRFPSLRRRERVQQGGNGPVQVISRFRKPDFVHRRVDVVIPTLPDAFDGYRIVQLTDLHFGPAVAYKTVMAGIAHSMTLNADLIALTGDYVTSRVCDTLLPAALRKLSAPDGVFAVMGNHDHWTNIAAVRDVLASVGVEELCNRHTPIQRGDASIYLAGVDSVYVGKQDLNAALWGIPDDAATILLAHEPDFADEAAATGRIALQLSGHSHGGSIQLPYTNTPLLNQFLKFARKYPFGMYRPQDMWLYTSAGIGRGQLPRINALPEITEIMLWQSPVMRPAAIPTPAPQLFADLSPEMAIS